MDSLLEVAAVDSTLADAIIESLREECVLDRVLQDARISFEDQVPLKLTHCDMFLDRSKILELGEVEKANAFNMLWNGLSNLGNPDGERCDVTIEQFYARCDQLMDEFVASHAAYKHKAEQLMENRIETLCAATKSSIEKKLKANPEIEIGSLVEIINVEKEISLERITYRGNVTLVEEKKEKLKKKLDELAEEILAAIRRCNTSVENSEVQNNQVQDETNNSECTTSSHEPNVWIGTQISENNGDNGVAAGLYPATKRPRGTSGENDSLIFFLKEDKIEMAMLLHGTYQSEYHHRYSSDDGSRFKNIQWRINSNLGVDKECELKCGGDDGEFSLKQLLRETYQSERQRISFQLGQEMKTEEVSIEFLLGSLLKIQKDSATTHLSSNVGTAIIIVPTWLLSFQRIQFKDAAMIAGFNKVHLVNEESVTAYAYASVKLHNIQMKSVILIIGYNFNFRMVSATLYEWNGKNVTMMDASYFSGGLPKSRLLGWMQGLLSKGMEQVNSETNRKALFPPVLPLKDTFVEVLEKFGFSYDHLLEEDYGFGGSIFEEIKVEELHKVIQEYSPGIVGYCHGTACKILLKKTRFSTRLQCDLPMKHFQGQGTEKIEIRQYFSQEAEDEREGIRITSLGELEFNVNLQQIVRDYNKTYLQLNFEVSSEGILSLDVDSLKLLTKSKTVIETPKNSFAWSTKNTDDREQERMKKLVFEIWQRSDFTTSQISDDQNKTIDLTSP